MTNQEILAQFGPREAMEYDVVVVGAGPGGLATAIRLKQLNADLKKAKLSGNGTFSLVTQQVDYSFNLLLDKSIVGDNLAGEGDRLARMAPSLGRTRCPAQSWTRSPSTNFFRTGRNSAHR